MSILQYLQLQPVDPKNDGSDDSDLDQYAQDETISLKDNIDAQALDKEWTDIVDDLEKDPDWFKFDDE